MNVNSRLIIAAHAPAWIDLYQRQGHGVATSEPIAVSANTNPVVIRRLLNELREGAERRDHSASSYSWSS
ncbi:DNA-binding IscR family transcriptional regulator [Streptomyces ambofaciens]